MIGPTAAPPGVTCSWQAFSSGGSGPYEYQWSGIVSGTGTGTGTTNTLSTSAQQSGNVTVTVYSDDGQEAQDQMWVSVFSGAQCLFE